MGFEPATQREDRYSHYISDRRIVCNRPFQHIQQLTRLYRVIVTQVIRMVFGYNPDPTSNRSITSLSQLSVWTGLHLGFAIICACLPVLRMYLPKEDGALNTRLKLFYQSVSGWTSRISQSRTTPRTTEQQLPNYASRIAYSGYKVPSSDEIPLRTQSKTLVGSSGREYHQPQTQEYA